MTNMTQRTRTLGEVRDHIRGIRDRIAREEDPAGPAATIAVLNTLDDLDDWVSDRMEVRS